MDSHMEHKIRFVFENFPTDGAFETVVVVRNMRLQILGILFDLTANTATKWRCEICVRLNVSMQIQFARKGPFANRTTETDVQFVFDALVLSQLDLAGKRFLAHATLLWSMELTIMILRKIEN